MRNHILWHHAASQNYYVLINNSNMSRSLNVRICISISKSPPFPQAHHHSSPLYLPIKQTRFTPHRRMPLIRYRADVAQTFFFFFFTSSQTSRQRLPLGSICNLLLGKRCGVLVKLSGEVQISNCEEAA